MFFFDANTRVGKPMNGPAADGSAAELLTAMDRAGIDKALVWHVAQQNDDPLRGNDLLAAAIVGHTDRLAGCAAMLPPQTGELGDIDGWFDQAAAAGMRAARAWPTENRYLLRGEVVGPIIERLGDRHWPLILGPGDQLPWDTIYNLLAAFPELTVILADVYCWGPDRFFRPLIERYPNVYLEISDYFVDGGIEAFVNDYGSSRLLFGSGYPTRYPGAMMLALAGSEIADADKEAIAGGNMDRLMEEVRV